MYIKQNFGKKGSNIPPTTKKNIYNLPMTRPSLGLGPSWSPHFQSMPLTTRVPTRIIRANSIPLKGGGILLQRCKVSSKMAQIVATLLFEFPFPWPRKADEVAAMILFKPKWITSGPISLRRICKKESYHFIILYRCFLTLTIDGASVALFLKGNHFCLFSSNDYNLRNYFCKVSSFSFLFFL